MAKKCKSGYKKIDNKCVKVNRVSSSTEYISGHNTSVNFGGGFLGLLTILFIGLKLTGYIKWSWWWVLAPLWAPIALGLAIFIIFLIIIAIWGRK